MNKQIQSNFYLSDTFILNQWFLALLPDHSSHNMFPLGLLIIDLFLENGSVGIESPLKLFDKLILLCVFFLIVHWQGQFSTRVNRKQEISGL